MAYLNLTKLLKAAAGYRPIIGSLEMSNNIKKPTLFSLVVDDFGIKYYNKEDLLHLKKAVEKQYTCKVNWKGTNCIKYTIKWNYDKQYVDISMPKYIEYTLQRLLYKTKIFPQYNPHSFIEVKWTTRGERPYARQPDATPFVSSKDTKYVQTVVDMLLYYARDLDNTMLVGLNDIGTHKAQPITNVINKVQQLLYYAHTYPQVYIRFYASDMQLHVYTDAALLVLPKARRIIAGYFRLLKNQIPGVQNYDNKGAILIEFKTLHSVVTSAVESETHGVFINAKKIIPLRHLLTEMNHIQSKPTPVRTDNSIASGFANKNMIMKHSNT